jgi:hypothetical protein
LPALSSAGFKIKYTTKITAPKSKKWNKGSFRILNDIFD